MQATMHGAGLRSAQTDTTQASDHENGSPAGMGGSIAASQPRRRDRPLPVIRHERRGSLALTRKTCRNLKGKAAEAETVEIIGPGGEWITIRVIDGNSTRVRLQIQAPDGHRIVRGEMCDVALPGRESK